VSDGEMVVDFLNTLDVEEETDALGADHTWLAWLDDHGLAAPSVQPRRHRARARVLRDELRLVAEGEQTGVRQFPLTLSLVDGQPRLGGGDAIEEVLGAVARLAVLGELGRVKICPADDCRWAFYDTSRNGSRQWCSMAVCGNRAKARAHRARQSEPE
jgi:predicted RNA-binding Zn ribbon-like protein